MPVAVCQGIEKTAMPRLARFQRHLEAEPAVGVLRLCGRVRRGNRHRTAESTVAVYGAQMLVCFRPLCGDPASAHNTARLHLEDVCEVATDHDLELKPNRLHAVVGDVKVFVQPAPDRPADG